MNREPCSTYPFDQVVVVWRFDFDPFDGLWVPIVYTKQALNCKSKFTHLYEYYL